VNRRLISPKYLLTLPGELDITPTISIDIDGNEDFNDAPELFFNRVEDILEFIDNLSKDNSTIKEKISDFYFTNKNIDIDKEIAKDKASTILDIYFSMFDVDYINKDNWKLFSMISNLETPRKLTKYTMNNKIVDNDSILASCIKNNTIDEVKVKQLYNAFLDDKKSLINISFNYLCNNSKDLMNVIIQNIFDHKSNVVIKRCENCGKLYIPKKLDTKYCDRISPQFNDKTCKQAMDIIKKNEALNDPIKRLYKNIYNTLYISYSNNKSKESKKVFNSFVKDSKIKDLEYKKGIISQEDYDNWLRSFYKRK
jgi:hypothetical protein